MTNMLLLDTDPTLSGFHHPTTVQNTEPKPMVDMVTASVDGPTIFLVIWDAGCFHDDVLDVTPCQAPTNTNRHISK